MAEEAKCSDNGDCYNADALDAALACVGVRNFGLFDETGPRHAAEIHAEGLRRRAEADRAGALLALRKQEREGDACAAGRR